MTGTLSHYDDAGNPHMVDIGEKPIVDRRAVASGELRLEKMTLERVEALRDLPKGDPLTIARISAVQAVKRTAELIPMCHPVATTGVEVTIEAIDRESTRPGIECRVEVRALDRTGVEMEALTGVTVALLTIYDMLKAIDKTMEITAVRLREKSKSS